MSDANEVNLARQDERMKIIVEMLTQSRSDQKEMNSQLTQMLTTLSNIDNRVRILEESLETSQEMHREFTALKYEIAGAKRVIRWLWVSVSGLVAFGVAIKAELMKLLS